MVVIGLQMYGKVSAIFKDKKDADGNVIKKAGPYDYFLGQATTFLY